MITPNVFLVLHTGQTNSLSAQVVPQTVTAPKVIKRTTIASSSLIFLVMSGLLLVNLGLPLHCHSIVRRLIELFVPYFLAKSETRASRALVHPRQADSDRFNF